MIDFKRLKQLACILPEAGCRGRRTLQFILGAFLAVSALVLSAPAEAGQQLCNRTGYVLDAALAIETGGATATQGWFRILPGACETVLAGSVTGDRFFLHTRTAAIYGERPEATEVSRMLCVQPDDFLLPGAESCGEGLGRLAPFTEVTADFAGESAVSELTDGAGLSLEEARRAGLGRLLKIAGYPADGAQGRADAAFQAALDLFRADHGIASSDNDARLFAALIAAAEKAARSIGLTLCNASGHRALASYGAPEDETVVTHGWYDLAPKACVQVRREPIGARRIFVYGEAVGGDGRRIAASGQALIWAGEEQLCTGSLKFEIAGQGDCAARGLDTVGFRAIETNGARGLTVRIGADWPK